MNLLKKIAPKNFLGRFALAKGAKIVGIIMCIISVICVIAFLIQLVNYKQCEDCSNGMLHDLYSFIILAIVYCVCMFFINVWFLWGVLNHKASVILCWVIVTGMWVVQAACLVLVMVILNIASLSLAWIVALIFAVVTFLILGYFILIGYGYWLELKGDNESASA